MSSYKRLLAIGDIHGQYEMLLAVLDKAKYNHREDKLILLGDYIDRGPNSKQVVNKVRELVAGGAVALLGNHEAMMIAAIKDKRRTEPNHIAKKYSDWKNHSGGEQTFNSFAGNIEEMYAATKFFATMPLYYATKDFVFAHGAVNPLGHTYLPKQGVNTLLWKRQNDFPKLRHNNKTIVVGHTPVQFVCADENFIEPLVQEHAIYMDTGAVWAGEAKAALTVMDLFTKEYWQV